jgi:hypothetical protein
VDFVYGLGWFPIHHLLHYSRIYGDATFGNSLPQKFHTIQPKFEFGELGMKLMISQMLQDNSKVLGMLLIIFLVDEDIIDKDHYEFVEIHRSS